VAETPKADEKAEVKAKPVAKPKPRPKKEEGPVRLPHLPTPPPPDDNP
jgi:hypothetical protein